MLGCHYFGFRISYKLLPAAYALAGSDERLEERGGDRGRYYKLTQLGAITLDEAQQLWVALNAWNPV